MRPSVLLHPSPLLSTADAAVRVETAVVQVGVGELGSTCRGCRVHQGCGTGALSGGGPLRCQGVAVGCTDWHRQMGCLCGRRHVGLMKGSAIGIQH
eukprot:1159864-Pelagomonas_calceolata.AAC.4